MNEQERDLYDEFVKRHCEVFNISISDFFKNRPELPRPVVVESVNSEPFEPNIILKANLCFSTTKILIEIEEQVRQYKKLYERKFENFVRDGKSDMPACHTDLVVKQMKKGRLVERATSSPHELEVYRQQLTVYDLREREKLTFSEILDRSEWASELPDIYNRYNAAKRYIDIGPPFGPPFRRL